MPRRPILLTLLLAVSIAIPAGAYTIYLKDGSRILARAKYTTEGEKAIIVLENGTQTFLNASEIDVQRTESVNEIAGGNALVFEDGKFVERSEVDTRVEERQTVADLIARGEATMRGTTRQPSDALGVSRQPVTITTRIEDIQRQPMRDLELTTALKEAFAEHGLEGVPIFQGTERQRPLIELTADSEASVFHNLEVAAAVLLSVRENHAEQCEVMELLMSTANKERAGEFALTAEMAESITADGAELSAFFVDNVRF